MTLPSLPTGYAWEKVEGTGGGGWAVLHVATGDTVLSGPASMIFEDADVLCRLYECGYRRGYRDGFAQCKACYVLPTGDPRPPGH